MRRKGADILKSLAVAGAISVLSAGTVLADTPNEGVTVEIDAPSAEEKGGDSAADVSLDATEDNTDAHEDADDGKDEEDSHEEDADDVINDSTDEHTDDSVSPADHFDSASDTEVKDADEVGVTEGPAGTEVPAASEDNTNDTTVDDQTGVQDEISTETSYEAAPNGGAIIEENKEASTVQEAAPEAKEQEPVLEVDLEVLVFEPLSAEEETPAPEAVLATSLATASGESLPPVEALLEKETEKELKEGDETSEIVPGQSKEEALAIVGYDMADLRIDAEMPYFTIGQFDDGTTYLRIEIEFSDPENAQYKNTQGVYETFHFTDGQQLRVHDDVVEEYCPSDEYEPTYTAKDQIENLDRSAYSEDYEPIVAPGHVSKEGYEPCKLELKKAVDETQMATINRNQVYAIQVREDENAPYIAWMDHDGNEVVYLSGDGKVLGSTYVLSKNIFREYYPTNPPKTPEKPNEPDKPKEPDKPNEPDQPGEPDKPQEPDRPNKPEKPSEPPMPEEPTPELPTPEEQEPTAVAPAPAVLGAGRAVATGDSNLATVFGTSALASLLGLFGYGLNSKKKRK